MSIRRSLRSPVFLLLPLFLTACGGDALPEASDLDAAGAGAAVAAVPSPDPALFDSIAWPDTRAALDRGATVYAYSCARCHGDSGRGDGKYRLQGRLLQPPSFLAEDWRFGNDLPGLRQAVHLGTDQGMPHWGDMGLTPRDTDAVARYVMRLWRDG